MLKRTPCPQLNQMENFALSGVFFLFSSSYYKYSSYNICRGFPFVFANYALYLYLGLNEKEFGGLWEGGGGQTKKT